MDRLTPSPELCGSAPRHKTPFPAPFPVNFALPFLSRALAGLSLTALLAAPVAAQPPGPQVRTDQVLAELLAHAPDGVGAGRTVWLGLQMAHAPDWHTYWKNPGDSGLPTQLQWTLPRGVSAGDIQWPAPKKFPIGHLANYGYEGRTLLPVPLTIGPEFNASVLDIQLEASWLVCRKECIPEEGRFVLRLPVGTPVTGQAAAFADAAERAPRPLTQGQGHITPDAPVLRVQVQGLPPDWVAQALEFFPETSGVIEPGAAWTQRWEGHTWRADIPLSSMRSESPAVLPVVLVRQGDIAPGHNALGGLRVELPTRGEWPPLATLAPSASDALPPALQAALDANAARAAGTGGGPPPSALTLSLGLALLGALVGGLLLNLMPCVFPVLAIKVLAFAQHANDRAAHRRAGLAYTAGVVLSFAALGGLLLALRAAGEQIGWGFQLQNPAVVAALAALFTLIGLNLAGLFEFGQVLPSRVASWQARSPTGDAFLTGVLATAVASPCTAPFMGASLGLAVALPATQALAVFAAMGLGLALPYLAASWLPAVARALPRPGPWMATFRQFLAFPMFATVVWLLWVLAQQSGADGVAALLGLLVGMAWLLWAWGRQGRTRWALGAVSTMVLAALLAWLGPLVTRVPDTTAPAMASADGWQPWSPERMAQWQSQGRVVFVDYTAAWCVTCQFNKKTTLADATLLADFAARDVVLARADWTRRDPAVTQALAALGRSGVPVYALYRDGRPVRVLSEILSVPDVRAALQAL